MATDFEDGVWRTVGGRRIFIKDGESLSSAMKKSGKFKSGKKVKVEGYSHKVDEDYEDRLAKYKEIQKDANKKYDNGEITKEERNKLIDDAHDKYIKQKTNESDLKQKYMNIPEEERVKAYEEGKNWKDLVKEYDDDDPKKLDEEYDRAHGVYRKEEQKEKEPTFEEKREYLKQKGINELNNFTKDDDDTFIRKEYDRQKALESDYRKDVDYYLKKGDFDKADELIEKYGLEDEREEFIEGQNSRVRNDYRQFRKEKLDDKTADRIFGEKRLESIKNALNEESLNQEQQNNALKDFRRISGGKRPDEVYNIENGKYTTKKESESTNETKQTNSQYYRNAFNEYKKKHPNTKLNLQDFIDMSEGKK